ncbi:hypothetical protein ZIOFF_026312 [Zingiber officinale]|uniref:DUF155 domain-containing protein n=1 Tax=Zingiber officinale TaxID=94328 RepID=A0A8J5H3V4_ZINOF|nr:hypothetical protein ZIOFF_026312 [Zingiber officinale]
MLKSILQKENISIILRNVIRRKFVATSALLSPAADPLPPPSSPTRASAHRTRVSAMRLKLLLSSFSRKTLLRHSRTLAAPPTAFPGGCSFSTTAVSRHLGGFPFFRGLQLWFRQGDCLPKYFSAVAFQSRFFQDEKQGYVSSRYSEDAKKGRLVPVNAYFLSTSIDLKSLRAHNAFNVISPASRVSDCVILRFYDNNFKFENDPQVIEFDFSNESNCHYVVVFQYGSVVLFNVSEQKADGYLKIVENHALIMLPERAKDDCTRPIQKSSGNKFVTTDSVACSFTTVLLDDIPLSLTLMRFSFTNRVISLGMIIDYSVVEIPTLKTWMEGGLDHIMLKSLSVDGILTIASVLGQSIALDYFIRQVDGMVELFSNINHEMEKTGYFRLKNKMLLQLVGKANSILEAVILKLKLFDRPEIAWKNANYAQIWEYLRDDFELTNRFGSLHFKLEFVERNISFFRNILQNRKMHFLDSLIVTLLVVEILMPCGEVGAVLDLPDLMVVLECDKADNAEGHDIKSEGGEADEEEVGLDDDEGNEGVVEVDGSHE